MNKIELRKEIINIRKNITKKNELSNIIVDKIVNLDIFKKSRVVALYNSMASEVNTESLINKCFNKKVLLPRIVNNEIVFIEVNNDTKYTKSNIGVMEPIGEVYLSNIDLIIVPGLAFDNELNRLGFGMGYYDKYLSNKNIYKIGICFDKQIVKKVPINHLDIKMDMVITEKRVLKKV